MCWPLCCGSVLPVTVSEPLNSVHWLASVALVFSGTASFDASDRPAGTGAFGRCTSTTSLGISNVDSAASKTFSDP